MIISKNNLASLHFLKGFFILILQTVMAAWLESLSILWFLTLSDEKKRREESGHDYDNQQLAPTRPHSAPSNMAIMPQPVPGMNNDYFPSNFLLVDKIF